MQVGHHEDVGEVIEEYQKKDWRLEATELLVYVVLEQYSRVQQIALDSNLNLKMFQLTDYYQSVNVEYFGYIITSRYLLYSYID